MNRNDFLAELKRKLRKLPYDEIKEAVDYYNEYFDDAGNENEQSVLDELGPPSAVASQIIAGFAVKGVETDSPRKNGLRSAWVVVLALFASPVAVPLAIATGAVAVALIITASAVVFSFFAAGFVMLAGGIAYIVTGILVISQSYPTTLFMMGVGLVLLGAGAAVTIATTALSRKLFGRLAKQAGSFILRRKSK